MAIQDVMMEWADRSLPDDVTLLFELFQVYSPYFPEDTFDTYYPWGEVMLNDFNELDKSLADPAKVFAVIADLKEIDAAFGLPEEELQRLKDFWGHYFDKHQTVLKENFAKSWRHLLSMYREFHARIDGKGWSTEGMAFRKVADRFTSSVDPKLVGRHVVFAGLYALSRSEERVVQSLLDAGLASLYWDADRYYVEDTHQEAGHFLRSSTLFDPDKATWIGDHFRTTPKEIEVVGIPMEIGQAKFAGQVVQSLMEVEGFKAEKTAVVLPAEHLLFPVLYSLPGGLEKVNVTTGYPLHQTSVYYLVESLIRLQTNFRRNQTTGVGSFFFQDVWAVLDHPFIRAIDEFGIQRLKASVEKEKSIRITQDRLLVGSLAVLFKEVSNSEAMFAWCRDVLGLILRPMASQEKTTARIEAEFISRFAAQLNRLEDIYKTLSTHTSVSTWWNLFREILSSTKIPFSGEPLEGLQVMGFLESRVIDFEHVILLSVNENVLPSAGQSPSFIPYGIRKAFGLPTHEERHAVTAYHFYRLLQRAQKVWLVHNTVARGLSSGEPSRFIVQLEREMAVRYPDQIKIRRRSVLTPVEPMPTMPIVVQKSPEVMKRMEKWNWDGKTPQDRMPALSPSAINQYISCPLRFYLSHVAGLWEKEDKQETLEAGVLGKVLHLAMELIYAGKSELQAEDFKAFHSMVLPKVNQAIAQEFTNPDDLEGKNLLLRNVIVELVHQVLRHDEKQVPIRLLSLEQKYYQPFALSDGRTVMLKGVIDRLEEQGGSLRVIDYKTGKVDSKVLKNMNDLFTDPARKEDFQTVCYAFMVSRKHSGRPVEVSLITLKAMSKGSKKFNQGKPLQPDDFSAFESGLRGLLDSLFDPKVPFVQTADHSQCHYCSFKDMCSR